MGGQQDQAMPSTIEIMEINPFVPDQCLAKMLVRFDLAAQTMARSFGFRSQ